MDIDTKDLCIALHEQFRARIIDSIRAWERNAVDALASPFERRRTEGRTFLYVTKELRSLIDELDEDLETLRGEGER